MPLKSSSGWLVPSLFLTSLVFGSLPHPTAAAQDIGVEKLPFCDDDSVTSQSGAANRGNSDRNFGKRLIYVTTLDGRIAALDLEKGGEKRWDVETGPGELLSSSIQNLELTNKGQVVRIIPSLSGSLYQLTGRSVEAIPITAENLLSLSYKFSDDLVISGGKDTRSYGVSARTGKIIYECTMSGCKNESMANAGAEDQQNIVQEPTGNSDGGDGSQLGDHHDYYVDDVVVVRRQTQTVRAIDPRTGIERWNFSVGNHELDILTRDDCHQNNNNNFVDLSDIDLRVVVPEGLICAYSKATSALLWQHKFDFPIVNAWRMNAEGKLAKVDLFNSVQWMYDTDSTPNFSTSSSSKLNPSIYVGLFKTQMYVQESEGMRRKYHEYLTNQNKDLTSGGSDVALKTLSLPWRPVPAIKTDLMALDMDQKEYSEKELIDRFALMTISNPLAMWHASKGFYIVDDEDMSSAINCPNGSNVANSSANSSASLDGEELEQEITLVTLVSMWYWWKEIVVISLTSALVLNLFLNNSARLRHERAVQGTQPEKENVIVERYIEIPIPMEKSDPISYSDQSKSSGELSVVTANPNFTSRFLSDFDMIQCLGKGGFGVVFEAKNKLDDCRYAVKRIVLPTRKDNRDRVMREVKTLANCEHQNIVRFFQAWVEQPPRGWQEDQDNFWLSHQDSIMSTSIDMDGTMSSLNHGGGGICSPCRGIFAELNTDECLSVDEEQLRRMTRKTAMQQQQDDNDDDEDSFIEFRYSTNGNNNGDDDIEMNDNILQDSSDEEEDEEEESDLDSGTGANYTENSDSVFKHQQPARSSDGKSGNKAKHRRISLTGGDDGDDHAVSQNNTKMYLYIQMQLCQKQSLKEWLQLTGKAERMIKIVPIFEQIIQAVEYVHLKGLIHRDLKPSNIFFALDGTVKVGDFGLVTDMEECPDEAVEAMVEDEQRRAVAGDGKWLTGSPLGRLWGKRHTQQVGTHLYMSPEQVEGGAYDYKVDIFSLGLILFELLVVFSTEMERIKALTSLRQNHFPTEYLSAYEGELDLLKLMLSRRPQERPTTFGIRARPPLNQSVEGNAEFHFELPSRRKDSRSVSS